MGAITRSLPKDLILQAARDLRLLDKKGRIVCDTEDETSFIMDRAIHDIPGRNRDTLRSISKMSRKALFGSAGVSKGPHTAGFFLYEVLKVSVAAAYG